MCGSYVYVLSQYVIHEEIKDKLQESVLCAHHVGLGDEARVMRFGFRH